MAISTRIYNEQALSMLNRITGQIQDDQSRIATGKNVLRASDNPAVSTKISFTKDQQMMLNRFNVNIDRATNRLGQAEVAIGTIVNILQRTYELSIQARNGTNSPADLKTIGTEISNLRDQMLSLSNSQDVSGNYLFAGYRVHDKPFIEDDNGVVKHNGDAGIHTLQISENQRLATNLNGADVFLRVPYNQGVASVFSTLDSMIEKLNSGTFDEVFINQMNESIEHFTLQQTRIGSQVNRANLQQEVNDSQLKLMREDLSNLEDADIAKLVTDLQSKLVSRNAAQQAFVKISQESLFNYLR
jgi:flagellar hook-associated protein 3 FlgL